jgi:hypothetical protein
METDPVSETLCSSVFLEYRTIDKVQKPNSPECHIPSSEPFKVYVMASSSVHWRADCYLVTSYNIRPTVACVYHGVFIESLPRNGLHDPFFYCCVNVLLNNSCFCGSTVLAWSKYATIYKRFSVILISSVILIIFMTFQNIPFDRSEETHFCSLTNSLIFFR